MGSINFTDKWVQGIKVESGREVFHDAKVTGLGLRVSSTGRKVWQVSFRVKGNPTKRRMDLGKYPAYSLIEARDWAREILLKADRGEDPQAKEPQGETAVLFSDLAAQYMEKWAKPNKRSWYDDEVRINGKLLPAWGSREADSIKRKEVIAFLEEIASTRPSEARSVKSLISRMYNWGIGHDLVESNPALQIRDIGGDRERDRVLTNHEIKRIWIASERLTFQMRATVKLRFLTGQRGGEIKAMRWSDIDENVWTIPKEVSKNGISHRVPLVEQAQNILEQLREAAGDSEWVFPAKGSKRDGHLSNVQYGGELLREYTGIDFNLHDIRRTVASNMASMGVPRLVISRVLNHSEGGVTRIYDRHSYDNEKREALEAWSERLMEIVA